MNHVILVVGLARGGTTSISTTLAQLDYLLSFPEEGFRENPDFPETEGGYLALLLAEKKYSKLHTLLNGYNGKLCFKRPDLIHHPGFLRKLDTRHRIVFVFRDPLAIAQRRVIGQERAASDELLTVLKEQELLLKALRIASGNGCRCLFVSYEKLMEDTREHVKQIATFAGHEICNEKADELVKILVEHRKNYRLRHGQNRMEGEFALLSDRHIAMKMKRFFPGAGKINPTMKIRSIVSHPGKITYGARIIASLPLADDGSTRLITELGLPMNIPGPTESIALDTSDGFARLYSSNLNAWPDKEEWQRKSDEIWQQMREQHP